jgi:hypothetical protein
MAPIGTLPRPTGGTKNFGKSNLNFAPLGLSIPSTNPGRETGTILMDRRPRPLGCLAPNHPKAISPNTAAASSRTQRVNLTRGPTLATTDLRADKHFFSRPTGKGKNFGKRITNFAIAAYKPAENPRRPADSTDAFSSLPAPSRCSVKRLTSGQL